jgi:hypothetical protein
VERFVALDDREDPRQAGDVEHPPDRLAGRGAEDDRVVEAG